jgi:hypothetical protein
MKSLAEKIMSLDSRIVIDDFAPFTGSIAIYNDSNEKGEYVKEWNNLYPQPSTFDIA